MAHGSRFLLRRIVLVLLRKFSLEFTDDLLGAETLIEEAQEGLWRDFVVLQEFEDFVRVMVNFMWVVVCLL